MSSIIFKRSLIAASLLVACQANAALYRVVDAVDASPSSLITISATQAMGVAIQPGAQHGSMGCFGTDCGTGSDYKMAVEKRVNDADGFSYREEVPFAMDHTFQYVDPSSSNGQSLFLEYCDSELKYSTCDAWANKHYLPWGQEKDGSNKSNAQVYVEGSSADYNKTDGNSVINSLEGAAVSTPQAVGNNSDWGDGIEQRNKAFSLNGTNTDTKVDDPIYVQSRAFYSNGNYTVGSVSRSGSNNIGTFYSSKPAIWSGSALTELPWGGDNSNITASVSSNNAFAEGSIRSFVIKNSKIYAVGYNTYDSTNYYMDATVFVGSDSSDITQPWTWNQVQYAQSKQGDTVTYSNSVLTAVNDNLVAIGEAKYIGGIHPSGASANKLFVVNNVSDSTPRASYLSGGIFFSSAGGKMGAINNYNEIVGQVDAEDTREVDGKPRRVRGFIDPYNGTGTDSTRRAIFENKAWWLDDLTNGGEYSSANNAFRILDATGINDDGVISATAIKCAGGYSSTNDYATCDGIESTVAVKLVPIDGATSSDIDAREHSYPKVDKKGGSFGLFGLAALGLFGIRRKLKS